MESRCLAHGGHHDAPHTVAKYHNIWEYGPLLGQEPRISGTLKPLPFTEVYYPLEDLPVLLLSITAPNTATMFNVMYFIMFMGPCCIGCNITCYWLFHFPNVGNLWVPSNKTQVYARHGMIGVVVPSLLGSRLAFALLVTWTYLLGFALGTPHTCKKFAKVYWPSKCICGDCEPQLGWEPM